MGQLEAIILLFLTPFLKKEYLYETPKREWPRFKKKGGYFAARPFDENVRTVQSVEYVLSLLAVKQIDAFGEIMINGLLKKEKARRAALAALPALYTPKGGMLGHQLESVIPVFAFAVFTVSTRQD